MNGRRYRVSLAHLSLLLGIASGVATTVYYAVSASSFGIDFRINYLAARASLEGQQVVGYQPLANVDIIYQYSPTMTLFFRLFTVFPNWRLALLVQSLVSLVLIGFVGRRLLALVESFSVDLSRRERWLCIAFLYLATPTVMTIAVGQMNFYLLALFLIGYVSLDRRDELRAGGALALAAVIKIFPGLLGLWLLRKRAYRAIGAAVVTGLGLIALGVAVFGIQAQIDHLRLLLGSRVGEPFRGGLPPSSHLLTLRRALSNLFPAVSSSQLTMITTACLLPVLGALYWGSADRRDDMVVYLGTLISIILFIPSNRHYVVFVFFPLLPLLFLTEIDRIRGLYAAGTAIATLPPVRPLHIDLLLNATPVPSLLADGIRTLTTQVLLFGTIPFYGLVVILLTTVYHHRTLVERSREEGTV